MLKLSKPCSVEAVLEPLPQREEEEEASGAVVAAFLKEVEYEPKAAAEHG